jgi:hypothetical protein
MTNFRSVATSFFVLIPLFLLVTPVTKAQYLQAGANFMVGSPQGEFSDNVENTGFGVDGFGGVLIPNSPFMVGADFGFLIYGNETRKEPFSTTIQDVTVNVETSNNIVLGHLFLRLQAPVGAIRPYMDGLVGFNYLFTRTSIKNENGVGEEIASSTNFDDTAFSYGAGGGLQIRVYDGTVKRQKEGKKDALSGVFLDFKVRYLVGGEAEYLKEGSIARENGEITYSVDHSKTDLLTFHLGAILTF